MFSIKRVKMNGYAKSYCGPEGLPIPAGEKLGNGSYGAAYQHKTRPDRVFKIASDRDAAYRAYIEALSQVVGENEHIPIIYYATIFEFSGDEKIMVVEMERLERIDSGPEDNEALEVLPYFGGYFCCEKKVEKFNRNAALRFVRNFLKQTKEKYGLDWDMHCGNVMLRDGCTPVVTDPFVN